MAKTSPRQRKSVGRAMHEYKHGELKRGSGGNGGKVKNRRQAVAIALHEAGASKHESKKENKRDFARTKSKERYGETGQQERESKSHVGARGRRESSRAMGGENAMQTIHRGRKPSSSQKRSGDQILKFAQPFGWPEIAGVASSFWEREVFRFAQPEQPPQIVAAKSGSKHRSHK